MRKTWFALLWVAPLLGCTGYHATGPLAAYLPSGEAKSVNPHSAATATTSAPATAAKSATSSESHKLEPPITKLRPLDIQEDKMDEQFKIFAAELQRESRSLQSLSGTASADKPQRDDKPRRTIRQSSDW